MDKRLTRTDYLFAVTFIFMLVVALGAFFFGLKMGQERTAVKYEKMLAEKNEAEQGFAAYHQQYLVSFYHTIYQPYREFHKRWFDKMEELQTNSPADASLILKELAKLAKETYDGLGAKSMPDSSPLLKEAHMNYMRSLKLFNEALGGYQSKANAVPGTELVSQLDKDAYLEEAKNYALRAEKEYYESIVKWNQTVNEQFKPIDVTKPVSINDWSRLGLNMKNEYIAQMMMTSKLFKAFTPQDLTARIDEMLASGQAKNLNLQEIEGIVDVLIATNAVRPGDFLRGKNRYANETLPQLPFFTN
ncbi:hypothetical protein [Paenibacillus naphthalenovorans]|uniref:hypothetical protein n=1 Tax=Paenibacillus naphthalenovorans TaxID=162209 RepID=UPI003D2C271C